MRKLLNARYISTIDFSSAYHQIHIGKETQQLTAFTVPGMGLFEFTGMPYGVVGGPATFQYLSDKIIGPEMEPHAFSYLDDIIIVSETFEEHIVGWEQQRPISARRVSTSYLGSARKNVPFRLRP